MPDDEEDTVPAPSLRGTPPDMSQEEIEPLDQTRPVTPAQQTLPSPALSSPVSLYQLGITQLSPLRRQFSSSPRSSFSPRPASGAQTRRQTGSSPGNEGDGGVVAAADSLPSESDEDTQDNRDVLVQRLSDLMDRLTRGSGGVNDETVTALHHKADEMEAVLAGKEKQMKSRPRRRRMPSRPVSMDLDAPMAMGHDAAARLWGMPSPWLRPRRSDLSVAATLTEKVVAQVPAPAPAPAPTEMWPKPGRAMSPEKAKEIADEARRLRDDLSGLAAKFKARQEESDHIHALLIERAERAAQRIIALENQVDHLEDELRENDSELQALRIALKAIEVQCPPPEDMDDELRQSIQNWKADWKSLKEQRTRKMGRDSSALSSPRTPR